MKGSVRILALVVSALLVLSPETIAGICRVVPGSQMGSGLSCCVGSGQSEAAQSTQLDPSFIPSFDPTLDQGCQSPCCASSSSVPGPSAALQSSDRRTSPADPTTGLVVPQSSGPLAHSTTPLSGPARHLILHVFRI